MPTDRLSNLFQLSGRGPCTFRPGRGKLFSPAPQNFSLRPPLRPQNRLCKGYPLGWKVKLEKITYKATLKLGLWKVEKFLSPVASWIKLAILGQVSTDRRIPRNFVEGFIQSLYAGANALFISGISVLPLNSQGFYFGDYFHRELL